MKAAVIVPAAGRGSRMGNNINKQYLQLQNRPVLAHSLAACLAAYSFSQIIAVVTPGEEEIFRRDVLLPWFPDVDITVAPGGRERQDSVYNGLQLLSADIEYVCIHDGARPLAGPEIFLRCLEGARVHGAAIAAVPVKDTIKIVESGRVVNTLPRDTLRSVQTPQAFSRHTLIEAHSRAARAGYYATDDASLLEHFGYPVYVVEGDYDNIKVTTPEDMVVAETLLRGPGR